MIVSYPKTYKIKSFSGKRCTVECIKDGPSREMADILQDVMLSDQTDTYSLYCAAKYL